MGDAESLSMRAKAEAKAGDMEAALVLFQRAAAAAPHVAAHLSNAGVALTVLDRPREAARYFERALALDPDNAKIRKQAEKYRKRAVRAAAPGAETAQEEAHGGERPALRTPRST